MEICSILTEYVSFLSEFLSLDKNLTFVISVNARVIVVVADGSVALISAAMALFGRTLADLGTIDIKCDALIGSQF